MCEIRHFSCEGMQEVGAEGFRASLPRLADERQGVGFQLLYPVGEALRHGLAVLFKLLRLVLQALRRLYLLLYPSAHVRRETVNMQCSQI